MDKSKIGATFPELVRAAEGPVLDTSCAALLRLAQAVHQQGYKVALTGEGADEALAGYVWYKTQKFRDGVYRTVGRSAPRLLRNLVARSVAGRRMVIPPEQAIGGVRPAQQDLYEMISQSKPILYSEAMWQRLGDHSPYADLDITTDRMSRWHPLNQSLYVGYKVMLAGLLMISKGDRIAMNASVETRYPYLDDDVIAFCAGIAPEYKLHGMTEKWILRQVGPEDPAQADRQPPQDDVSRQPGADLPRPAASRVGRSAPQPRIAPRHRLFRRGFGAQAAVAPDRSPPPHPGPVHLRRRAHLRGLDPALAPHLLRRRTLRSAGVGTTCRRDHGGRRRDDEWSLILHRQIDRCRECKRCRGNRLQQA